MLMLVWKLSLVPVLLRRGLMILVLMFCVDAVIGVGPAEEGIDDTCVDVSVDAVIW